METPVLILLAENDLRMLDSMQETLEQGGYAVQTASSGEEAVHLIWHLEQPMSGLVTDIRLGTGPNGWDVARTARERTPELPVVYMAGDAASEWASQGVPKSVLLQKPFAAAQLVTAISSLINDLNCSPHLATA
ncbi:MAG TPA: response regulator [Allosphingosinicella sp.]|jgi:CheY-like chemotaxis protein